MAQHATGLNFALSKASTPCSGRSPALVRRSLFSVFGLFSVPLAVKEFERYLVRRNATAGEGRE